MKNSTAILLTATLALALASTAKADLCGELEPGVITPCNCGDTLVTDYVMTEDLDCSAGGHGIIIGANGTTLDGNGYGIYGADVDQTIGVYLDHIDDVTVTGCYVTGFEIGCGVDHCHNAVITGNVLDDNFDRGMYLWYVENSEVSSNWIMNDSVAHGLLLGIYVADCSNNVFCNNHVNDVGAEGIKLHRSSTNTLFHNHFRNVGGDNAFEYDTANGNYWDFNGVGNYWDDYPGSGPYPIPGDGDGVDNHPHQIPHSNPGDIDQDGDIGLDDATKVTTCLAGPGVTTPPPGVDPADFAACDLEGADGDVDLADWAVIQRNFDP